jgi:pSer/pThr/pTyr-binding forkhead associated (FHA) protein
VVLAEGERCLIGRTLLAQVICNTGACSREHCVFEVQGGQLMLTDLRSTGGTWVNRKRITGPTAISTGAVIFVGRVQLEALGLGPR